MTIVRHDLMQEATKLGAQVKIAFSTPEGRAVWDYLIAEYYETNLLKGTPELTHAAVGARDAIQDLRTLIKLAEAPQ